MFLVLGSLSVRFTTVIQNVPWRRMLRRLALFAGRKNRGQNRPSNNTGSNQQPSDREEDGFLIVGETAIERSTVGPDDVDPDLPDYCYLDAPPSYESQVQADSACQAYQLLHLTAETTMGQRSSNQVTTEISPEYVGSDPGTKSGPPPRGMPLPPDPQELPMYGPGSTYHSGRPPRTPRTPHSDAASVVSTLPGEILSEEEVRASARTPYPDLYSSPITGVPFKLATWLELQDWDWAALDHLTIPNINLEDYNYDFSVENGTLREYNQIFRGS